MGEVKEMEKTIKELTLLLIYLTSWQEEEFSIKVHRSWKGYPFEILNELQEEGYLSGSKRAKSVFLTREGIIKAKEFMAKYVNEK
jgi:hypothetical protein